jgi:catalytic LigB subunit of aromatic ring-opening dioxygenase
MGEILGIGLSHYPGPLVPGRFWARMLARNVKIGRVAPALFEDKSQWPDAMLAEWSDDEGAAAGEAHEARLLLGYERLREELDAFAPDVVLIWGDDQYENYKRECVPPWAVGIFDSVNSRPYQLGRGVFATDENPWGAAPGDELQITGHRAAATQLYRALINDGFEPAYSLAFTHPHGLAHSFNNTVLFLDRERNGFPYPVVPIHVNCYGNALLSTTSEAMAEGGEVVTLPPPTPRRCFEIGAATARFFAQSPWRVAIIGSASFSHGSLTAKHGRLYPDLDADRARVEELSTGRWRAWAGLSPAEIENAGQHEILNWVCLAGAMSETSSQCEIVDYVESHLFNSSKCFAVFRPATKGK